MRWWSSAWIVLVGVVGACGHHPPPGGPTVAPPTPGLVPPPVPPAWAPPSLAPPGQRLPHDFEPRAARLQLSVDPERPIFVGEVAYDGELTRATPVVWLHAERLTDVTATLQRPGDAAPTSLVVAPSGVDDVIALYGTAPLAAGPVTLRLTYQASLDATETYGAFRQQTGGDWYAFTQFEPTGARLALPCLDEPDRKLPWTLTMDVPTGMLAVANAPMVRDVVSRGGAAFHHVEFAPTPPLPSYLLAFGVGPFDVVDAGVSAGGAPLRILTPRGRAAEAAVAAATVPQLLARAEAWFGSPYPFAKLDSLVIPTTISFGAMENPGLITYGEKHLLMPPDAPATRRRNLAQYVAHELAHMWFGDLVTPAYWDDLWLNESFASWVPNRLIAVDHPAWVDADDAVAARDWALHADSLRAARRLRQPIGDDGDIAGAFDDITYEKGAAVLRMFERWLGPDVMQQAVRSYLAQHAYGTATAADFVAAASATSGKDVTTAMGTFLDQGGAPEVSATITCSTPGSVLINLEQRRYLPLDGAVAADAATPPRWHIPVCVAYGDGRSRQEACTLLDNAQGAIVLPADAACPRWAYANAAGAGYYRVAGAAALEATLTSGWAQLDIAERLALVQDLRAQVARGALAVDVLLRALPPLVANNTEAALAETSDIIRDLEPQLTPTPALRRWVTRLLGPTARRLGWTARRGSPDDARGDGMRGEVLPLVADLGGEPGARRAALALASAPATIPPAVRAGALRVAIIAEPARFDALLAAWRTATDKRLREDLLGALAAVPDEARLRQALALTLDPALDARDTVELIAAAVAEPRARPIAEAFVMANLDALLARLPRDYRIDAVRWLTASCDAGQLAPMRAFVDARLATEPGSPRAIAQAFEAMAGCSAQRAARAADLAAWQRRLR